MNISLIYLRSYLPKSIIKMYEMNLTTEDEEILAASSVKSKNIKLIGNDTEFTKYGRLTGYNKRYRGLSVNLVPDDMYSFGDYILDEDTPFNLYFLEHPERNYYKKGKLISVFDSKILNSPELKKRNDIFNIFEE